MSIQFLTYVLWSTLLAVLLCSTIVTTAIPDYCKYNATLLSDCVGDCDESSKQIVCHEVNGECQTNYDCRKVYPDIPSPPPVCHWNCTHPPLPPTYDLSRKDFQVQDSENSTDIIIVISNIPDDVLIYVRYKKLNDESWSVLAVDFAINFPIVWKRPSLCRDYEFQAVTFNRGIVGQWSEKPFKPMESPTVGAFKVVSETYMPGMQWKPEFSDTDDGDPADVYGNGSVYVAFKLSVLPQYLDQNSRFHLNNYDLSKVLAQKFSCKRTIDENESISRLDTTIKATRVENETNLYGMLIPSYWMEAKCTYVLLGQTYTDTLCERLHKRITLDQFRVPCGRVHRARLSQACAEDAAFTVPRCTSRGITYGNLTYTDDGRASIVVRWNLENTTSKLFYEDYWDKSSKRDILHFQVYYSQPLDKSIVIQDSTEPSGKLNMTTLQAVTTCMQNITVSSENITCNASTNNVTLTGLETGSSYGAVICAIYKDTDTNPRNYRRYDAYLKEYMLSNVADYAHIFHVDTPPARPASFWVGVVGGPLVLLVIIIACISYVSVRKGKKRQRHLRQEMSILKENYNYYKLTPHDLWELDRCDLRIYDDVVLGKGAFGVVYKGVLLTKARAHKDANSMFATLKKRFENCEVAIKRLPDYATEPDKEKFLAEISLMKRLAQDLGFYEHIVNPLACITGSMPYCLIMEFCTDGCLLDFVRDRRNYMMKLDEQGIDYTDPQPEDNVDMNMILTARTLFQFAVNVIYAMEHISAHGYVHRDLAARNILVDRNRSGVGYFAKVADFGMTRKVNEADPQYMDLKGGKVPIKWLALESLQRGEYTVKTDVWSFGVLLFEIMSLGGTPYANINPHEMLEHLEAGHRLEAPEHCEPDVYELMKSCWAVDPDERPQFMELREKLSRKYEEVTESYNYITSIDADAPYYQSSYPLIRRPPIEPANEEPKPDEVTSESKRDEPVDKDDGLEVVNELSGQEETRSTENQKAEATSKEHTDLTEKQDDTEVGGPSEDEQAPDELEHAAAVPSRTRVDSGIDDDESQQRVSVDEGNSAEDNETPSSPPPHSPRFYLPKSLSTSASASEHQSSSTQQKTESNPLSDEAT